jgi:hypothetical protein
MEHPTRSTLPHLVFDVILLFRWHDSVAFAVIICVPKGLENIHLFLSQLRCIFSERLRCLFSGLLVTNIMPETRRFVLLQKASWRILVSPGSNQFQSDNGLVQPTGF